MHINARCFFISCLFLCHDHVIFMMTCFLPSLVNMVVAPSPPKTPEHLAILQRGVAARSDDNVISQFLDSVESASAEKPKLQRTSAQTPVLLAEKDAVEHFCSVKKR